MILGAAASARNGAPQVGERRLAFAPAEVTQPPRGRQEYWS